MAPKSPWNKKATINANAQKSIAVERNVPIAINYGEVQTEETEVLQAIYMEDFEDVKVKGAWSKTTDRSFKLRLRSFSDEKSFVVLSVRLTATYPKTAPLLDVQGLQGYHERTQERVRNIIQNRPKQLLGEVMIHAIANEIQDALEDAVQARQQGALPSLEDERATAEEVATALAKQAEEAKARRQADAQEEEDRMLKQMVDEEVNRREKRKPVKASNDESGPLVDGADSDVISFDRQATLQVLGETLHFYNVRIISLLSKKSDEKTLLAKPQSIGSDTSALMAVKRMSFDRSREDVMELESTLSTIQNLRHTSLLSVLAYRVDKLNDSKSELVLCSEYADRGNLHDLLEIGSLNVTKARQFTIELLEALDYLHRNGVAHGNVSARTVALTGQPSVSPKLADFGYSSILPILDGLPSKWRSPESDSPSAAMRRRSDIWQLGVVVAQMFLGLQVIKEYNSPHLMLGKLDLSESFDDLLHKMFTIDSKKRPSAFDLLPAEYLRTNDPVMDDEPLTAHQDSRSTISRGAVVFASPAKRRSRHNSSNILEPMSRYANDFTEIGRLGKGGFGEVVKARNKLDGGIYAVKKIKQAPQLLDQVISEVMLLNRLNHPYVVRYFSTWVEEDTGAVIEGSSTATETTTETETPTEDAESDGPRMEFGLQSTGGLDFVSSSGYPQIEFGADSDEEEEEHDDNDKNKLDAVQNGGPVMEPAEISGIGSLGLRKSKSDSRRAPSTLYIQMEYCERRTLRDLIRKSMGVDDSWRYVRQITEGLAHVHGHGIIHRDLKPDNIFIDVTGNPKIGDFGLATTTQHQFIDRAAVMSGHSAGDMTQSVGTTLYVAPELRSGSSTSYNDKVDMYSLGIIFYEMCEPFSTAMERIKALQQVREKDRVMPSAYHPSGEKAAQGKLISCLISHKPSERPSSTELLRSDVLPLKIEDETIRQALSGLSDPKSPYHQKMMSALFSQETANANRIKALAWDAKTSGPFEDAHRLRLRSIARETLEAVFRRHGAEEARRQTLFPRSGYYTNANIVQLLDASGNLLQLPYDLILPHARQLARHSSEVRCLFTFGNAYRDAFTGGPPKVSEEVDFDITDSGNNDEQPLSDAEIVKVMDEIACEMPVFAASTTICFHLNHASILNAVLEHCRVPVAQQHAVKEFLSRLGFHQYTWSKVRVELRKYGLPDTTLDDMQQFDFRDPPEKAFSRLRPLFDGSSPRLRNKLDAGISWLSEIARFADYFGVQRKIYVAPLGSVNTKFYEDGFQFQCVLERRANRVVIAAGGRYDSLIRAHRSMDARVKPQGAVGVSIGLDPIISNMAKNSESKFKKTYLKDRTVDEPTSKRCDVLVAASGIEAVRQAGVKLLTTLWANGISTELAIDRSANIKEHSFIVAVKHEASSTVRVINADTDAEDPDVPISSLVSHLQQELRERESNKPRPPTLLRQASHHEVERKSNVQVLLARHGSKKSNKYQIVGDAQEQWSRKLDEAKNAPILAVETRDDVLELVQQTRLSDAESWRKAVQSVQLNDRQYVQQIQEMLSSWRKRLVEGDGMREACVFNFRTQHCIYYDLGL